MSATAPKIFNVGKLSMGAESTYNTASGSLQHVRCISADVSGLESVALEDAHLKQGDYSVAQIIGPHQGQVVTTHQVAGWTTNTDPGAPTFADPPADGVTMLMSAIGSALGAAIAGGKATDVSASAGSTITCTTTSFTIGQGVVWNSSEGGARMGWITNTAGGNLTLLQSVSTSSPSHIAGSSGSVYGSYTAFKTTGNAMGADFPNTDAYTLEILGHETDDKITCTGCLPTALSMDFPIGEIPTMSITWGVGGWDEVGSGGLGGGVAPTSWAGAAPNAFMSGWVAKGASSATSLRIGSLSIDLGITRPAIMDPSATNGIGGFAPVTRNPVVNFSVFRSNAAEVDDFLDQASNTYSFVFGDNPGSMVGICVPAGRLVSYPTKGESDGAVVSECSLYCNSYEGDTGTTPAAQNSPVDSDLRISFG